MNKVKKGIRNIYLAEIIGDQGNIDLSSGDGFCKLWGWAVKQDWWDKEDFLKYVQMQRHHSDPLVNAIHAFLKEKNNV